jgi:glycine cleavage system H protein
LDGSFFYHKNHCWVKVVNPDEVVIGINGILAKLVYGIKTVVLPKTGEPVTRDQLFAHILLEKHIVPLIMPVNGVITAVNTSLVKRPELLQTDFLEKGWLVAIKSDNLEKNLRTLSFGSKAMEWYRAKDRSISEAIHTAYNANREHLGPTMQDGGELVLNASEILTSEQYNKILDDVSR